MHEAFDDGRRSVLGDCGLERLKREGRNSARFPSSREIYCTTAESVGTRPELFVRPGAREIQFTTREVA